MRRAGANKGAVDAKSLQAIIPSNTWRLDLKRLHPEIYHFPRWHMHNPPKTGRGLLGRTPRLTSFTSAWIYSSSHSQCSALKFSTKLCLEYVDWQQPTITISSTHTINHQPQHQPFSLSIFVPEIWSYLSTVLDGFVAVQIWVEKFQVWMFWAPGVPVSPSPIPLFLLGRTFKFKCVQL